MRSNCSLLLLLQRVQGLWSLDFAFACFRRWRCKLAQTLVEKVLSRVRGHPVRVGEVLMCKPDLIYFLELGFPHVLDTLEDWGVTNLPNSKNAILIWDHQIPIRRGSKLVELRARIVDEAKRLGIVFYDMGKGGINHQLVIEKGHILPGMFIVAQDTHATTSGSVGAISVPVTHEITQVMATGDVWVKVPETISIQLSGRLGVGVTWRDAIHWIMKNIGYQRANYKVLQFGGPSLKEMDMGSRMTICNISFNLGIKTAVMDVDDVVVQYLRARTSKDFQALQSDPDAVYAEKLSIDVSGMEPMVAPPPSPINPVPVSQSTDIRIQQAYLGSCASGHIWDLRRAAMIIKGREVAPGVRFIVVPSTQDTYIQAAHEGLLEIFVRAGAVVLTPSCGPCSGRVAPLADGEACVSTGTVNEPGRMGSREARIFSASALTVTASALTGYITDPRSYL